MAAANLRGASAEASLVWNVVAGLVAGVLALSGMMMSRISTQTFRTSSISTASWTC
jgi:hypothetical protein